MNLVELWMQTRRLPAEVIAHLGAPVPRRADAHECDTELFGTVLAVSEVKLVGEVSAVGGCGPLAATGPVGRMGVPETIVADLTIVLRYLRRDRAVRVSLDFNLSHASPATCRSGFILGSRHPRGCDGVHPCTRDT